MEQREDLLDRIPPLDDPAYNDVSGGDWLDDDDLVLGYVDGDGTAYAYPHKILNFHEIVNDTLAGKPVLASYCPLCRSGVVYDRRLDGRELGFGNTSALYQSDMVMYDRQTNSYWWHVRGKAIVGTLTGAELEALPSSTTTWAEWTDLHPGTKVLSRDTGHRRNYERDPFEGLGERLDGGDYPFPVTDAVRDDRLRPGDEVLGVTVDDESVAYPVGRLGDAAANDTVGGRKIVVLSSSEGPSAAAFSRKADGRTLTFELLDGGYRDAETGSRWTLDGRAVEGELSGERLEPVPSRSTFWFAFIAAFPETEISTGDR